MVTRARSSDSERSILLCSSRKSKQRHLQDNSETCLASGRLPKRATSHQSPQSNSLQGRSRDCVLVCLCICVPQQIFRHYGDAMGVNSAQVSVWEHLSEVFLSGGLKSAQGSGLPTNCGYAWKGISKDRNAYIRFCSLGRSLSSQKLERFFADEQVCALLILQNFPQSNRSRSVTMWFLDTLRKRTFHFASSWTIIR